MGESQWLFGTSGRDLWQLPAQGPLTGAGYSDTDIGLLKNIHITEAKYIQFRGDFLNAFNNVQLGHFNSNYPSPIVWVDQHIAACKEHPIRLKFYY